MRSAFLGLLFLSALTLASCGRCRTTSDCETSERCDFDTGDCVLGCTSNAECASTARCNLELGRCEPKMRPPLFTDEDASSQDVVTSTQSDATTGD